MDQEYIKAKLRELPHEPGSYQMKDKSGTIIYVGKAKDLHNRVNSYFVGAHNFKTQKLVQNIDDFDFIVTASEKEALVLEINLIKKNRPKYNIQFMDDSSYPYIKLTKEEFPRLMTARDLKKDRRAAYFGPFPDANAASVTLKLLQSLYPFRRCVRMQDKVCLYYHMGQCLGPCQYPVDADVYTEMSEKVTRFMKGDTKEIAQELEKRMQKASDALEFEKAQEYKELLASIHAVAGDKQNIEKNNQGDMDIFAYYSDRGYLAIAGLLVRRGTILNKEYRLKPLYGEGEEEFVSFLIQYYQDHPSASELVLPKEMDVSSISEVIGIPIVQPQKGYRRKLMEMAQGNAKTQLDLKFNVAEHQEEQVEQAVQHLNELAGVPMNRVELFDNSHISGTFTVASCVVYEDGQPDRKSYRLYKLHTANSDVDSMKEVIYRRYFRLLKENGRLPDGILVDGGWTQIEAVKEILSSLGLLDKINIMGLVKNDKHTTDSLMDSQGNTIALDKNDSLFFLLTRMQDEVHRTAISYHRKLRSKAETKSVLDEVEGIGPKRKRMLLREFGSFTNLKNASMEEIAEHVPEKTAQAVYEALHQKLNDEKKDSDK
ncbi:MAG: excinuclease ABC subunit UvrC [Solobacterium sp.]|jgi:excinuclease ABC subunit C|nr:excinuclease ABC subunit UvrC [Solobacterium sp.]MCH4205072.1 excinuclease ABC subunit UvrC [Solobacterium sp.]MCH4226581.1 excinuclease ABC subunit UvrC [Solobacterium sp.]MCH4281865.1 excinuclease ABC subunit UvrC [Solobacterium sp.]